MSTLFEQIIDIENIEKAYKQTRKGKRKYKVAAIKFARDETYNLLRLQNELKEGTWTFGEYVSFRVFEPKERVIHAPSYECKIVQLAINNVLKNVFNTKFIYDSYACIDGKGTHKAVDRVSYFMRHAAWRYGKGAYIIKLDIKKFFYSIDRTVLKEILGDDIKCNQTLVLLFKIIDSAKVIDSLGLPLGNTLSQPFANAIMNKLDQYCKRVLRIKYYVRYADDVVAIVESKELAIQILRKMTQFLNTHSHLQISEHKTKIFPLEQGVNAYGFKIYKTHRLLRDDSKKKIKRKTKKMPRLIVEGKMTVEKAEQILNSWLGHAKNGNSFNFIRSLIARNSFIYLNNKGVLKVNLKEVYKCYTAKTTNGTCARIE